LFILVNKIIYNFFSKQVMVSNSNILSLSSNVYCKVCLRLFRSEHGLLLHRKTISKYNIHILMI